MIDFLHKWLGIPADEQPPNHYRLLGLRVFEDDPEVIDAAADKHLAFYITLPMVSTGKLLKIFPIKYQPHEFCC